jgi:RimJ/RimL family protein N-acetyltransferase
MIRTARLLLRPFERADLAAYAALLQDERMMAGWGGPYDLAMTELVLGDVLDHRAQHGFAPFAVVHEGALIGNVGLQLLEDGPDVELLYRLSSHVWGRGLATEAAAASLDYGFLDLGLQEIVAVIAEDNEPSLRLAARLGFERGEIGRYWGHALVRHSLSRERHARPTGGSPIP